MSRHEHWLFRTNPKRWPDAVILQSVDTKGDENENHNRRSSIHLRNWCCVVAHGKAGAYKPSRQATGATPASYWGAIRKASSCCNSLWVFSAEFRREAAVLQLWDAIEAGAVRIAGVDSRAASKGGNRRRGQSTGICVLEDPPIILSLHIPGCGCKIMWVDAANYGIDVSQEKGGAHGKARALCEWFVQASESIRSVGCGGWCATVGSQAQHLFRSTFLDTPILSHTHTAASAMERDGLFGGRCECFTMGKLPGKSTLLDFRGLYSHIGANMDVPTRLQCVEYHPSSDRICELSEKFYIIAEVCLETDEPDYPYRHEKGIVYPVGRFTTTLCGNELHDAMLAGRVRLVRRAAYYVDDCSLKAFMRAGYQIRLQAERNDSKYLASYAKSLLNALPGKFAQIDRRWVSEHDILPQWAWGEWYKRDKNGVVNRWRSLAGNAQREQLEGWSHGTVPAISCAIASQGRLRLLQAIRTAGRDNVHYVDTDSLIVNDIGYGRLCQSSDIRIAEWGCLQVVAQADYAEIFGIKHYQIGDRYRCSGRFRSARIGIGAKETSKRMPTVSEFMRQRQRPSAVEIRYTNDFTPQSGDTPREPGGRVKPLQLWEWK